MSEVYNQAQENFYVDRGLTPLPQPHLTGMKLKADIVLGDFAFNTIDEYGVTWVITDINGWWQHPEPDMPSIARGFGDGDYDIKGRYNARILTLSGVFITPTPDLVEAARDRLVAATNLVYRGAWLKTGGDAKRASFVRLSGAPQIQTMSARGRTEFSIGLKAANPLKFSWNDAEPDGYDIIEIPAANRDTAALGLLTVTNNGNVDAPIELEINGPITGPARVYNKTTDKLLYIVSSLRGRINSSIENKQVSFNPETLEDIATLTTRTNHGLLVGDLVEISGMSESYLNGDFTVTAVPTNTTFSFSLFPNISSIESIVSKKLQNNIATIQTRTNHNFSTNQLITIQDVDTVFNGTYAITSTPTATSFTYAKNRVPPRVVTGAILVSNIATLTTSEAHQFIEGESVTISGININYNGTYIIVSIDSPTTFSYALTRTNSKAITNKQMSSDVASITMGSEHGFVVGENVSVSGLDDTFDGTYKIVSIPTSTSFTYKIERSTVNTAAIRSIFSGVATITLTSEHGFSLGEQVFVSDVGANYDGTYTITQIPSSTTFSYAKAAADETAILVTTGTVIPVRRAVVAKQLIGGVATLTTSSGHGFFTGETVTISSMGTSFDGSYVVTSVPSTNTFTYSKASANVPFSVAGAGISSRAQSGTTASVITSSAHNFTNGQYVTINNMDSAASALNGTYVVNVTSGTTFTYTVGTSATIAAGPATGATPYATGGFALASRSIPSTADAGAAVVSGSLPFTAINGSASVSADILSDVGGEIESSGVAIKKTEVVFTPGISGAAVDFGPDILEINTLTRDVFLNGSYDNARAKLDVLTDFFFLQPGDNEIEFVDEKNSVSRSLLKVYYRSAWLG
jgi:hypothetical protein